ncbi:hypothetical protein AUK10_00460 [Candidatus Gracilibacteria bacterium CG2_30_37_12]|nr:MAG: hypothetical protein AUK10_00460 [Candidatus Gracilibacteria bacterium CG2_30_37_12]
MRQIRNSIQQLIRYWKNRKFRKETALEKQKRYLFDTQKSPDKRMPLFTLFREKKRFYYFNTLVNILEQNKGRFHLSFLFIGIFLIVASIYILFFSPYFRVSPSKVIIERLDSITDINIAYKSIEDVYNVSLFSIDTNTVFKKLTNLQKNIKHIEVSKLFPNGLKIVIESYKPQFFVRFPNSEKSYIITSNGILVYQKANDVNLSLLDLVDASFTEMSFIDYKAGIREEFMPFLLKARDFFKTTFPTINTSKFTYFKSEREIHIALESGLIVLLRTADDIESQILSLKIYNDKNNDFINSGDVQYIDMRIPGKIFTCKDKILCKANLRRVYGEYYK